jgi:hypothetical protein
MAAGAYVGYPMLRPSPDEGADGSTAPIEPIPVEPTPTPAPVAVIESTPAAVRERALERYLTATQGALRDLPDVPPVWLTGEYLATPSAYPDVLDVWQTYLSMVRSVRQEGPGRYRTAYEEALDDAAVMGDDRPDRLARGIEAFSATAALGEQHFERVEALASAAIQSHSALLEAEGLILFDPAMGGEGRGGLGVGVSGRDADSAQLLDQILGLLSDRLEAEGLGPRTGANVREWVWDGFLNAVAR